MFWFSQVFELILMLLKNLLYLFKAFSQSSEMDFFFLMYTNLFLFCFILDYLYIKRVKLKYFWFVVGDEIGCFICEDYNISTNMICLDHGSGDF